MDPQNTVGVYLSAMCWRKAQQQVSNERKQSDELGLSGIEWTQLTKPWWMVCWCLNITHEMEHSHTLEHTLWHLNTWDHLWNWWVHTVLYINANLCLHTHQYFLWWFNNVMFLYHLIYFLNMFLIKGWCRTRNQYAVHTGWVNAYMSFCVRLK